MEAGSRCCQWETGWEGVTSSISSRRSGSITERCSHEYSQHCLCIAAPVKQQFAVNSACLVKLLPPPSILGVAWKQEDLPSHRPHIYPRLCEDSAGSWRISWWSCQSPPHRTWYGLNADEPLTNCFLPGGSPRGKKAPGSLHSGTGGVIYKEAKTRLCRASGIDRRFIRVQIGFHGQLEGTDAARRDWHPLYVLTPLILFLTGKHLGSDKRTYRQMEIVKAWGCHDFILYLSTECD